MKYRLIAFAGAAIVAASSPLVAAGSPASAASQYSITFASGTGCQGVVVISEDREPGGAYVLAEPTSDPCGITIEAIIEGPDKTPFSAGNPINKVTEASITGDIPINSGNHHGIRWESNSCLSSCWNYNWVD